MEQTPLLPLKKPKSKCSPLYLTLTAVIVYFLVFHIKIYEQSTVEQFVQVGVNERRQVKVCTDGNFGNEKFVGRAAGVFNDTLLQTGWGSLEVKGTGDSNDSYYAMGYVEGYLTHGRIDEHYVNTMETFFGSAEIPLDLKKYLTLNLKFINDMVESYGHEKEYWRVIGNVMAQFYGLVDGYQLKSKRKVPYSALELFLLNADGDLEDLIPACDKNSRSVDSATSSYRELVKSLRCSALIRILPNASDLVWGHTTWDQYSAMNRIYKTYKYPVQKNEYRTISMSSSPGYLASVDDFYVTNQGLAIIETTNGLYKNALYDQIQPTSILTWMRSMAANIIAQNTTQWATVFSQYNSGTYNNQWMIMDLHLFKIGHGFLPNGFRVLEQMPNYILHHDMSKIINQQQYWASYNIPYYSIIYNATGFSKKYAESNYSSHWNHTTSPRAKIFQRDAVQVKSLEHLKSLLRQNKYQTDPYSLGHPSNAIAARYDLEHDSTYALNGGIDTKVSSLSLASTLQAYAINGPTTHNQNPPFTWQKTTIHLPHHGHPNTFEFPYQLLGNTHF